VIVNRLDVNFAAPPPWATVVVGPTALLAPGPLIPAWQQVLLASPPPAGADVRGVRNHVLGLADRALRGATHPELDVLRAAIVAPFANRQPAMAQGIVVAGAFAEEVHLRGNHVDGAVSGIRVAVSDAPPAGTNSAGRVVIRENDVRVRVPLEWDRERHGIFVGNCRSLMVSENRIDLDRQSWSVAGEDVGIKVWGVLGRFALVQENHMTGCLTGVRFFAVDDGSLPVRAGLMWIVRHNLAEGARQAFVPDGIAPGRVQDFGSNVS
jgi:nitrous oxidase accessory protein NosD